MGLTGAASVVSGAVDAAGAMAPLVTPNVGDIVSPTWVDLLGGKPAEVLPLTPPATCSCRHAATRS